MDYIRRIYKVKTPNKTMQEVIPEKSELPLLPDERTLNFSKMTMVQSAAAIAPGSLSSGFALGLLVSPAYGLVAMLFGVIGLAVFTFLNTTLFAKYGAEQTFIGKAFFGPNGTKVAVGGIMNFLTWGWQINAVIMIGRISQKLLNVMGYDGLFSNSTIWALLFMGISLFICYKGITFMSRLYDVMIPVLMVLFVAMTIIILVRFGVHDTLFTTDFVSNDRTNYMRAVECGLGIGFSWGFVFGSYAKSGTSENVSFNGTFIGYGIVTAISMLPGVFAASVTGLSDPIDGLMAVCGTKIGTVFLVILFVCSFCALVLNPYFQSCTLVSMFSKHLSWGKAVLINLIITPLVIVPSVYDHFGPVLSCFATVGGVVICVWVTDSLLRKFTLNMEMLFFTGDNDPYQYYKGFNISAWICLILGFLISFLISNPISGVIHMQGVYDLFGQTVPACVVSSLLYVILFKLFISPKEGALNGKKIAKGN